MPPAHRAATAAERKLLKQYLGLDASADLLLYAREHPVEFAGAWNAVLTGTFTGTKKQKKKAAAAKVVKKVKKAAVPKKPKAPAKKKKPAAKRKKSTEGLEILSTRPLRPSAAAKEEKPHYVTKASDPSAEMLAEHAEYMRRYADVIDKRSHRFKSNNGSITREDWERWFVRHPSTKTVSRVVPSRGWPTYREVGGAKLDSPATGKKFRHPKTGKDVTQAKYKEAMAKKDKKPAAPRAKKPKAAAKKKKPVAPKAEAREYENEDTGEMETLSERLKRIEKKHAEWVKANDMTPEKAPTGGEHPHRVVEKRAKAVAKKKKAAAKAKKPAAPRAKKPKAAAAKKATAEDKTRKHVTSIEDILNRGVPKPDFGLDTPLIDKLLDYQRDKFTPVNRRLLEVERASKVNYTDAIYELSQDIEEALIKSFRALKLLSSNYNHNAYEDYVPGEELPTRQQLEAMPSDRIAHMFIRLAAYTQAIERVVPMR